jgi:hypothetical protein
MHPLLIPSKKLNASRAGQIGLKTGLFAALVAVTIVAAALWGRAIPTPRPAGRAAGPSAGAVLPSSAPVRRPIEGTRIPRPPASSGLAVERAPGQRGEYRFSTRRLARPASVKLFEFYLRAMSGSGWTLMGQSEPDTRGEWALNWQQGRQVASLYLYLAPRVSFTVGYCPPLKYC